MNNTRLNLLDIAKGIGIFLVVFGHVTHNPTYREFIWNFHMPLFFFISGILYNSEVDFIVHLKKRIKTIVIPYVIFYLSTYLYWAVIERHFRGGEYSLLHQLIGLPYGTYSKYMNFNGALWFLPCLFTTDFIFSIIKKYAKQKDFITISSFIMLNFCLGTFLLNNGITYLPLGINTALFAIVFYGIGYMCKPLTFQPILLTPTIQIKICFLIIALLIVQIQSIGVYFGTIEKTDLTYIILALIGISLCFSLSFLIKKNKIIEFLGVNSLIIFVFQEQTYRALLFLISKILSIPVEVIRCNIIGSFITTVFTILCILPLIFIWNRWIKPLIAKI